MALGPILRSVLVVALALSALAYTKLALPAALATFLSALARTKLEGSARKGYFLAHAAAGCVAAAAVLRFIVTEAAPGIVQGGTSAAATRGVSRLREILFAEDGARKRAAWDPDGDGIGSALWIAELTGQAGVRGGARLAPPLLEKYPKVELTSLGPAVDVGGYWFAVCLPTTQGGLSADPAARVDEERAERRFVAYAWPNGRAPGLVRAYFIDERENISSAPSRSGLRRGREHAPDCEDAVRKATKGEWRTWRGKKPRDTLPGDVAAAR